MKLKSTSEMWRHSVLKEWILSSASTTSSHLDDIVDLTVHVYCPLAAADESYKRSIHSFTALSLPVSLPVSVPGDLWAQSSCKPTVKLRQPTPLEWLRCRCLYLSVCDLQGTSLLIVLCFHTTSDLLRWSSSKALARDHFMMSRPTDPDPKTQYEWLLDYYYNK